ncbi:MAG TPA: hypothetical protein PK835_06975 [Caldisericia bacterium]|nr:hypothetical protein [Caldisericia bacterium]
MILEAMMGSVLKTFVAETWADCDSTQNNSQAKWTDEQLVALQTALTEIFVLAKGQVVDAEIEALQDLAAYFQANTYLHVQCIGPKNPATTLKHFEICPGFVAQGSSLTYKLIQGPGKIHSVSGTCGFMAEGVEYYRVRVNSQFAVTDRSLIFAGPYAGNGAPPVWLNSNPSHAWHGLTFIKPDGIMYTRWDSTHGCSKDLIASEFGGSDDYKYLAFECKIAWGAPPSQPNWSYPYGAFVCCWESGFPRSQAIVTTGKEIVMP